MSNMICPKCSMLLKFGFEYHWHCYIGNCTFVCYESHDHPSDGGFCGVHTCGTYHEHCTKCEKLHDEKDGEVYGLCSLCEETEKKDSS